MPNMQTGDSFLAIVDKIRVNGKSGCKVLLLKLGFHHL